MSQTKQLLRQPSATYDSDFFRWSQEQARLLREARPNSVDWANLAEEVDSLGNSEESEIESRLNLLLVHLLKWHAQPSKRKAGWRATIVEQRHRLARRLQRSASLSTYPAKVLDEEYSAARKLVVIETRLSDAFPTTCPFSVEPILDETFWPEGA